MVDIDKLEHSIARTEPSRSPLLTERETTHGSFEATAWQAQYIKAALHAAPSWTGLNVSHREALEMIATKIARILAGNANEPDHWKDIAGYAELGQEGCTLI